MNESTTFLNGPLARALAAALLLLAVLPAATLLRETRAAAAAPLRRPAAVERLAPAPSSVARATAAPVAVLWTRLPFLSARVAAARPWLLAAWGVGVLLLSFRLSIQWISAQRLTQRRTRPAPREATRALAALATRLRITRPVRLLESAAVAVPTALGAFRPVVLFPFSALTGLSPDQLEALLAHELAHVRRHDYLVNFAQCVVETLFFYHPAVWWISHRIRIEREKCCDDLAVAATGDARAYARALVDLEQLRGGSLQLALAADGSGPLWNRVARLFPSSGRSADDVPGRLAGLVALSALLVIGAAGRLTSIEEVWPPEVAEASTVSISPAPSQSSVSEARTPARAEAPFSPSTRAVARAAAAPVPAVAAVEVQDAPASDEAAADGEGASTSPQIAGGVLSPEQLSFLKRHGVTPEFVQSIAALGYERASADELVSLRVHGVTREFLSEMKGYFGRLLPLEASVEVRIHGVTAQYLRSLAEAGLGKLSPEEAVELRNHGVTAEYLRAFREAGYAELSVEDAVSLRNHGVDPRQAGEWSRLGFERPSLEDLTTLRNHGVAPEYTRELTAAGLKPHGLEELVALRNHGVTAEYARKMKERYRDLSADELVNMRIHGR